MTVTCHPMYGSRAALFSPSCGYAVVLETHATPPEEIVIALDATDDPVRGEREGREYHGYNRRYLLLPLYIT